MNRNIIISKVMQKLSMIDSERLKFLKKIERIKDPRQLVYDLQKNYKSEQMDRQALIQFLGNAKEIGIFKKHFLIPEMEKGWRFGVKDHGLANQFRFES